MKKSSSAPVFVPLLIVFAGAVLLVSCEGRLTPRADGGTEISQSQRQIELQPGVATPMTKLKNPYENDAYAMAEGRRLYQWYNCSGCHFAGGGGIGPPLMDDDWIYGGEPQQILDTIVEGRANGMPAYGGRIAHEDALKIVAYVRSLSRDQESTAESLDRKTEDTVEERIKKWKGETPPDEPPAEESDDGGPS